MAPRTAKAKKAADVKVADSEAPKKGRGRPKQVEDPEPELDTEDKPIPVEKKAKRGKKADSNGQDAKVDAPPAKKGKKNAEEPPNDKLDDQSEEESTVAENDENQETNGHVEEAAPTKGRKKAVKKEVDKPEPRTGRGRKAKQETDEAPKKAEEEEKPKGKGRGRKAQPKAEEPDSDKSESVSEEPVAKGKKKGKAADKVEAQKDVDDESEEKPEPKKKEGKGKRNQAKKAIAKEDAEELEEEVNEPSSKKKKGKKDEKADEKEETAELAPKEEAKPKGRKGQKKAEAPIEDDEEPQDTGEPATKRRRKVADDKAPEDTKKKAPPKNKASTDYESIDFSNESKNAQGKQWNFKIASWNVDGIRAWLGKGGLDYIKYEKPDILCLQEIKCAQDKLPEEIANLAGYHSYWLAGDKDGYAGVGIYTTRLAMNVTYGLQDEELDSEGRIITAEYEQFYLICTYVPNSGRKLVTMPKRLQWNEAFRKHVKELDEKKPVIICGDMNVSHNEIDLTNPMTNRKNAGFTDEERQGITELLGDGFIDTFRHFNSDKTGAYTFWTYMMNCRAKNVGWRLDYFIVSERLMPSVCDSVIRDQVYGSDHCPISLFLHLTSADKPKE